MRDVCSKDYFRSGRMKVIATVHRDIRSSCTAQESCSGVPWAAELPLHIKWQAPLSLWHLWQCCCWSALFNSDFKWKGSQWHWCPESLWALCVCMRVNFKKGSGSKMGQKAFIYWKINCELLWAGGDDLSCYCLGAKKTGTWLPILKYVARLCVVLG